MAVDEDLELLNAVLALALVDGNLSSGEKGIIQGLAARVGVGEVSLNAMIDRARREPEMYKDLRIADRRKARRVMVLLVAQARIDGEISEEERELLVRISMQLGIDTEEFGQIYAEGVAQSDGLRQRRKPSG